MNDKIESIEGEERYPMENLASRPQFLWRNDNRQTSFDFAITGVAAMVGNHKVVEDEFVRCIESYSTSGMAVRMVEFLDRVVATVNRTPKLFYKSFAAQRRAQNSNVFQSPSVVSEFFFRSLPIPMRDEFNEIVSEKAPLFESAVRDFTSQFLWGKAIGFDAVAQSVSMLFHREVFDQFIGRLNRFDAYGFDALLQGLVYGDERKPTTRKDRNLVTKVRKNLAAGGDLPKGHRVDKIARGAEIWAALWIVYGGRPSRALKSGDSLFDGLRSKDISELAKPFNDAFLIKFPRGPEPLPDTPFLRGRTAPNMRAGHMHS